MNTTQKVILAASTHTPSVVAEIISTYRGILGQYDVMKPFPASARTALEQCNFWQSVATLQAGR